MMQISQSSSSKPLTHLPSGWQIALFLLLCACLTGCDLVMQGMGFSQPTATPRPATTTYTPYRRYVQSMIELNKAPVGNLAIFNILATAPEQKSQIEYYRQLFMNLAGQSKIITISPEVSYTNRGLLPDETVRNVVVVNHIDGLVTAFVVTQSQVGWRSLLVDPQGAAYELYLLAQSRRGQTFFERDTASANRILEQPDLHSLNWVTARPLTSQEWGRFSPEQQILLQGQYAETRRASQPETIEKLLQRETAWVILPAIGWDANNPQMTALVHPTHFNVHIEQDGRNQTNAPPQRGYVRLPLGEVP